MGKVAVVALAVMMSGCAFLTKTGPVAVDAACNVCVLLQSTGACVHGVAVPKACPDGQQEYIMNYNDVLKKGAKPKLECRTP